MAVKKKKVAKKKVAAKKKSAVKKAAPKKKAAVKKAVAKKAAPKKKAAVKKAAPKKKAVAKAAPKATAKKKAVAKKAAPKKSAAKKTVAKAATTASPKTASKKKSAAATDSSIRLAPKKPVPTDDGNFRDFTPYKEKRGEDYMNAEHVTHFRKLLNDWKDNLMNKVDDTVHHMQDEAANFPDPNDRASQESEFAMELRTRDRERKLIKKIDESLADIDSEDYGYCTSCGLEIGVRRLEVRPTATQCIDCKTLNEIKEKQFSG